MTRLHLCLASRALLVQLRSDLTAQCTQALKKARLATWQASPTASVRPILKANIALVDYLWRWDLECGVSCHCDRKPRRAPKNESDCRLCSLSVQSARGFRPRPALSHEWWHRSRGRRSPMASSMPPRARLHQFLGHVGVIRSSNESHEGRCLEINICLMTSDWLEDDLHRVCRAWLAHSRSNLTTRCTQVCLATWQASPTISVRPSSVG